MPAPEIGRPLPRASDAYSDVQKWDDWILAEPGHRADWNQVFGPVDRAAAWQALATAIPTTPVISIRLTIRGKTCRVDAALTLNSRTATVRSAWHYVTGRFSAAPGHGVSHDLT
jgi:hypothetical protein